MPEELQTAFREISSNVTNLFKIHCKFTAPLGTQRNFRGDPLESGNFAQIRHSYKIDCSLNELPIFFILYSSNSSSHCFINKKISKTTRVSKRNLTFELRPPADYKKKKSKVCLIFSRNHLSPLSHALTRVPPNDFLRFAWDFYIPIAVKIEP